jgi:hypothetical protein
MDDDKKAGFFVLLFAMIIFIISAVTIGAVFSTEIDGFRDMCKYVLDKEQLAPEVRKVLEDSNGACLGYVRAKLKK